MLPLTAGTLNSVCIESHCELSTINVVGSGASEWVFMKYNERNTCYSYIIAVHPRNIM